MPKKKPVMKYKPRTFGMRGSSVTRKDSRYAAKPPGKRRSRSGKTYYERRRNRADSGTVL